MRGGGEHEPVKNLRTEPVCRVLEGLDGHAIRGGKQERRQSDPQRQGQHAAKRRGFLMAGGSQGDHCQHCGRKPRQKQRLIRQPKQHRWQHGDSQGRVGPDAACGDGVAEQRHGHRQQQGRFHAHHGDGGFQPAEMERRGAENFRQRTHASQEKQQCCR